MTIQEAINRLDRLEKELHAWNTALEIIGSDEYTIAPARSAEDHAEAAAVAAGMVHRLMTEPATQEVLERVLQEGPGADPVAYRRAELLMKERREMTCIPAEEYAAHTRLLSQSNAAWHAAKVNNDFEAYRPWQEKVLANTIRFSQLRHPGLAPMDAALQDYDTGMTAEQLDPFFELLRRELTPLILQVKEQPVPREDFLHRGYPVWQQREFSDRLMAVLRLDRERCCIAETEHPFTSYASRNCVRLTTHYHTADVSSSMFSVLHEGGHCMYALNLPEAHAGTIVGNTGCSAVDEGQSRFYENIIGRSLPFCRLILPVMRECFPGKLEDVTPEELYRSVNIARPSLIRTEADELTYPMHIMIRYELEKALLTGALQVKDLPGAWNEMYGKYLGISVPDDRRGVLQDLHWSSGMFGYFPSYALGSAYGPQMLAAMSAELPELWQNVERGDLSGINNWLGSRIHSHGRLMPMDRLTEQAFGQFDPRCYVNYLKDKFTAIYGL